LNELAYVFGAENVSFEVTRDKKIPFTLSSIGGLGFINLYAKKIGKHIEIFKLNVFSYGTIEKVAKLQIVDKNTNFDTMRKQVVVDGTDINLIRKLFIAKKKVSLYNPDFKENLNIMFMYDFEYLFLDCFQDCVVWPNKEVTDIPRKSSGQVAFKMKPKMRETIGFDFDSFVSSISLLRRRRAMARLNKGYDGSVPLVSMYFAAYYYNYLSLSYLCQNYCVMSVQKKDATKE